MIYEEWGFEGNPFETKALPANAFGQKLLVGREKTLAQVCQRIKSAPKIVTLEGLNGVGKTSVANVAAYKLFQRSIEEKGKTFYVPCRTTFQLDSEQSASSFRRQVLMEVAQTLIKEANELPIPRGHTKTRRNKPLERWLNSPQLFSIQSMIGLIGGGVSSENNASPGFSESGFEKQVQDWLLEIFPNPSCGGVVCVIDNLELLRTSEKARHTVEQLRDVLFSLPGIRWVLCGALGIIHGVASSPRLEGYLHKPIELRNVDDHFARELLTARIEAFSSNRKSFLPISDSVFRQLHALYRGNLRSIMSGCDDYCQYIADEYGTRERNIRPIEFEDWLGSEAEAARISVFGEIRAKSIKVFRIACRKGTFAPSDFEDFKLNSLEALRSHIRDLKSVGVLRSAQDETDKRRKTIYVTPKGWLVDHDLSQTREELMIEMDDKLTDSS